MGLNQLWEKSHKSHLWREVINTSEQVENRECTGRFQKGKSGNPGGRPKKGTTIVDQFRDNPKSQDIVNRLFDVASTLGKGDAEHPQAMASVKLIMDKLVPSLKSQDTKLSIDNEKGFVFMPEQKESDKA